LKSIALNPREKEGATKPVTHTLEGRLLASNFVFKTYCNSSLTIKNGKCCSPRSMLVN